MTLTQLSLTLPNRPGALAGVARLLAEQRINVAAITVDSTKSRGLIRLIVSDPTKAFRILSRSGYKVERSEMIAVRLEDRAGSFLTILDILAEARVNVRSVEILVAREGNHSLVALLTDDMPRTRQILTESGAISDRAERLVTNADLLSAAPAIPSESVGLLL